MRMLFHRYFQKGKAPNAIAKFSQLGCVVQKVGGNCSISPFDLIAVRAIQ
jgi:hypothetical protein